MATRTSASLIWPCTKRRATVDSALTASVTPKEITARIVNMASIVVPIGITSAQIVSVIKMVRWASSATLKANANVSWAWLATSVTNVCRITMIWLARVANCAAVIRPVVWTRRPCVMLAMVNAGVKLMLKAEIVTSNEMWQDFWQNKINYQLISINLVNWTFKVENRI